MTESPNHTGAARLSQQTTPTSHDQANKPLQHHVTEPENYTDTAGCSEVVPLGLICQMFSSKDKTQLCHPTGNGDKIEHFQNLADITCLRIIADKINSHQTLSWHGHNGRQTLSCHGHDGRQTLSWPSFRMITTLNDCCDDCSCTS